MGTAWTYALRSLRRNARRTALSIMGIGIGCALALGLVRALLRARARELDFARHLSERIDEEAELVVARDRQRRECRRLAGSH